MRKTDAARAGKRNNLANYDGHCLKKKNSIQIERLKFLKGSEKRPIKLLSNILFVLHGVEQDVPGDSCNAEEASESAAPRGRSSGDRRSRKVVQGV